MLPHLGSKEAPADEVLAHQAVMQVTSGAICFGSRHNILEGSRVPIQEPTMHAPTPSGTVIVHKMEYNMRALNGTWRAFKLDDESSLDTTGWFVCHESLHPWPTCQHILNTSGSPYEDDSGNSSNCEATFSAGVYVINRYDWSYYDKRGLEEGEEAQEGICLVDYAHGGERSETWSDAGLVLDVTGEYQFGRLEFAEGAARAFLYFTTNTEFTQTCFASGSTTLRELLTPDERYKRKIEAGEAFDGLEIINRIIFHNTQRPSDLVGPFSPEDRIFVMHDFEAILAASSGPTKRFEPALQDAISVVLDECIMSFLVAKFIPQLGAAAEGRLIADALFPRHTSHNTVDYHAHRALCGEERKEPCVGLERTIVCERLQSFVANHGAGSGWTETRSLSTSALCAMFEWLLTEIFDLAKNSSRDCSRPFIVPADVRTAIAFDQELVALLGQSFAFWNTKLVPST
ncbi:hypothetical protein CYMTET_7151 [Cymbomonas tetramitiformis]|uniref:Uncharacterized protein n=1 Tax=Cymbomonas tetramitiformis TaxID=36881 RepID=A0AAE0GW74_9CHLO|nr:hypothetical protein CYMTET_7151 [Cymbomonas tetramitiformis]|eukprot:gene674-1128_t